MIDETVSTEDRATNGGPVKPPAKTAKAAKVAAEPDVVLDLDTLERENAPEPFTFRHSGKRYLLADPQEVDWQDLIIAIGNTYRFFQIVVPADDQDAFFEAKMPSWKMKTLMERYQLHYGLPDPKALGA